MLGSAYQFEMVRPHASTMGTVVASNASDILVVTLMVDLEA